MRPFEWLPYVALTVAGLFFVQALVASDWSERFKRMFRATMALIFFGCIGVYWLATGEKPDETAYRYIICPWISLEGCLSVKSPSPSPQPNPEIAAVVTPLPLDRVLTTQEERALRPKDEFQECATCPRMVVVPAGRFNMGSPLDDKDRSSDEEPMHEVTIAKAIAVGKFEVTFAEWVACVLDGGCQSNRSPSDHGWGLGTRPVINVSWNDAKEYAAWLSRKTGKGYRLLTEAEWEYAARAGTRTPFHTGVTIAKDQANYGDDFAIISGSGEFRNRTVAVGSFAANAFGLHDMHGNVREWVEDCWHGSYVSAPMDGSAWTAGDCSRRVLRGGSWNNYPGHLRSAGRSRYSTGFRLKDLGFRLGRTLER